MIKITSPTGNDFEAWAKLMQGYFDFYHFELKEGHLEDAFGKVQSGLIHSLMAWDEKKALGVANYMFNQSTFYKLECYLSDLYVDEAYRGRQIAKLLMEEIFKKAKAQGCPSVHWLTATDNMIAQKLYDKLAIRPKFILFQHDF